MGDQSVAHGDEKKRKTPSDLEDSATSPVRTGEEEDQTLLAEDGQAVAPSNTL